MKFHTSTSPGNGLHSHVTDFGIHLDEIRKLRPITYVLVVLLALQIACFAMLLVLVMRP